MVPNRRAFLKAAASALVGTGSSLTAAISAAAERYPSRSVKVIVPFPPGGGTDIVARPVVGFLSRAFGQQFYIENKSGAGGNIGIEVAARSEPDGYTLLMAPVAVVARPHVSDRKIDPIKDLISVIQLSRQPLVIAVHPSLGVQTLTELVAAARREPGLRYGLGGGIGNEQHVLGAWFVQLAGITLEPVPYRGGGPAINDLLAGHVKVASLGAAPIVQHYLAGTVRVLAQATKERSPNFPDVPTFEEEGFEGLILEQWFGLFVPASTPPPIVASLNAEANKALVDPATRELLIKSGHEPIGGSVETFQKLVSEDFQKFGRLAKELKIAAP
jgi:tripartite-type tricarboxylate transporter receptor subunit TctC